MTHTTNVFISKKLHIEMKLSKPEAATLSISTVFTAVAGICQSFTTKRKWKLNEGVKLCKKLKVGFTCFFPVITVNYSTLKEG